MYSVVNTAFNEVLADDITICNNGQYGDCIGGAYTDEFLQAMKSKLKVVDYCGTAAFLPSGYTCEHFNSDYWNKMSKHKWSGVANIYSRYKALGVRAPFGTNGYSPYGVNAYNFYKLALLLPDGSVVYFGGLWFGPWIVVDVNNFQKGPNEFGKDVFVIHVYSNIKKDRHYIAPAGSDVIFQDDSRLNNSSYGITGCSKDIGSQSSNTVYEIAGSGCSAKYLME